MAYCEGCGNKKGSVRTINIPISPTGWSQDTSFRPDGEETDIVVLCNDCFDNEIIICCKCGYHARESDAAIHSDCDTAHNWECGFCIEISN